MAYIGNTPGVSSQRVVLEETITGSPKSAFVPVSGYTLGYVDVLVNGVELDAADFTAADGVTVTLATAAAVGDTVKIKTWLPRGLSDGYLKSESDARFLRVDGTNYITGVLGIGTSSPSYKLQLNSSSAVDTETGVTNSAGLSRYGTRGSGNAFVGAFTSGKSLELWSGASLNATLDASGNLGLGATPSAWRNVVKAIQTGSGSLYNFNNAVIGIAQNAYIDSVGWKYSTTAAASSYEQAGGVHAWSVASSGTAGAAVTFTQAMTLDASGKLGIGTTSPYSTLDVGITGANILTSVFTRGVDDLNFRLGAMNGVAGSSGTSMAKFGMFYIGTGECATIDFIRGSSATDGSIAFRSSGNEKMRITSSGNLGLGAVPSAWLWPDGTSSVLQLQAYGAVAAYNSTTYVSNNWYYNAGEKYMANGYATRYEQGLGKHTWFNAANNTSGAGATVSWNAGMTLTASSNLMLGGSAAGGTLHVDHNPSTSGPLYLKMYSSAYYFARFDLSGSVVGSITTSGSSVAYNTSSDYRLKYDIAPMTGALARVSALKPVTYKWNADDSEGEGFIAHELAEVAPQCVTGEKDAVDEDGNPVYQGIDTSFLVATLTAAIQELKAIVDAQAARIAVLEAK